MCIFEVFNQVEMMSIPGATSVKFPFLPPSLVPRYSSLWKIAMGSTWTTFCVRIEFLKYLRVEHGRDTDAGHDKVNEKVEETN